MNTKKIGVKECENVCKTHEHCYIEMPKEDKNILKYSHGEKSMKIPTIICANIESLVEKIDACHSNPEKSSTTKINKHTASGYLLFLYCSFNDIKKNRDYYRGRDI